MTKLENRVYQISAALKAAKDKAEYEAVAFLTSALQASVSRLMDAEWDRGVDDAQ